MSRSKLDQHSEEFAARLLDATVDAVEAAGDGLRITARFKNVADGDREALSQFATDMAYFKRQLPGTK